MKHTKKNIVRVLEAHRDLCHAIANQYKSDGEIDRYNTYVDMAICYGEAISLILKKDYFNELADILKVSEEEGK